jgi:hypothetical protein
LSPYVAAAMSLCPGNDSKSDARRSSATRAGGAPR